MSGFSLHQIPKLKMATSTVSSLLPARVSTKNHQITPKPFLGNLNFGCTTLKTPVSTKFRVQAAKLPAGVVVPKVEPKFRPPFLGFTRIAETWNSRACMIGLIGTFIVELILNKGILQVIGVDIGKGLDLPL
ncbi:light-harvesting complex-like protein OHP1, chloroplastic isoform X1 [Humulus lupulus]|uniref:light-harvesting complex-like protein OHP1, chloroplastic isoform X1 n=1 Tax=Humulus lupulus TaxID=3486 RepID=UPI002B40E4D5|nr:light-harvesting complex-like protein OHP1, chloroplastic isoform X1 [Humulus lupulus]